MLVLLSKTTQKRYLEIHNTLVSILARIIYSALRLLKTQKYF